MASWWNTLGDTAKQQRSPSAPSPSTTFITVVEGGADPNTPRPSAAVVYWKMDPDIDPVNKITGDLVFNADA